MARNGVTVFFQGHDHIFVKQEKDGVIYQTLPEPADPNYALYNREAYRTGDALPNSGRVRVTVSPADVRVEYVRSWLSKDENAGRRNNEVAFSYTVGGKAPFVLTSPAVTNGGALPVEFTGDGAAATLPLEWRGAPDGAKSYALIMHHEAPDQTKWYWILYNIPANLQSLPRNAKGIGTLGNNSVNGRTEYAPPHSKGPGPKTYVYTLYALSAPLQISVPPKDVNRALLLAAMTDHVLGTTQLQVVYSRGDASRSP
jgi:Raf kinase inhibitor-like YbhB/YbcL family protein